MGRNTLLNKAWAVGLILAMLTGALSGGGFFALAAAEFKPDTVIEAESGALLKDVTVVTDQSASGGKYITVVGGARMDEPDKEPVSFARYTVNITAPGEYQIWVRCLTPDSGSDSFWFRTNANKYVQKSKQIAQWSWFLLGKEKLTAGANTFDWCYRELKGQFDAFFVTMDENNLPKGTPIIGAAAPSPSASAKPAAELKIPQFVTTGGSAFFEAEKCYVDGVAVDIKENAAASGSVTNNLVVNKETPKKDATGSFVFEFKADKKARYTIWVRTAAKKSGNTSMWLSLDDTAFTQFRVPVTEALDQFVWHPLYSTPTMLEEGSVHKFRMVPRENGAQFDQVLVTSYPVDKYKPEGILKKVPPPDTTSPEDAMKLPGNVFPKPSIQPAQGHPRLLMRASDIPAIKANLESEQNKAAYESFQKQLAFNFDGKLEKPTGTSTNFNANVISYIECLAFDYAINGNEENGKKAVSAMKNLLDTFVTGDVDGLARVIGYVIFTSSEVYDWCYPLLTAEDKALIIEKNEEIAYLMEQSWPPKKTSGVTGHGSEAQVLRDDLSFAIAVADERPDIYNYVMGLVESCYREARTFWYASGTNHQGDSYGAYRWSWDLWAEWMIYRMSGEHFFTPDLEKVAYQWIYTRRPDGQVFRNGDCYNASNRVGTYWTYYGIPYFFVSNYFKNPYIKMEAARELPGFGAFTLSKDRTLSATQFLLINDPALEGKPLGELPLSRYFPSPNGIMVARTGWNDGFDAPDVVAEMRINEYMAGNHQHLDSGSFQLYYKGILASESGVYGGYGSSSDANYNKRSIAHNTLLIYDPNEKFNYLSGTSNDGGQKPPVGEAASFDNWMTDPSYKRGKVLGHEFGPDPVKPEYSYISGDITPAYSEKVKEVRRSMMLMPLEEADHPAIMIVADKVTSSDPAFKKTWVVHGLNEPAITGSTSVFKNNTDGYNGMMTVQTLLPENPAMTKVGGEGASYTVDGKDYPPTADNLESKTWRLEVSPSKAAATDYFLNVLQVGDADKNLPPMESTKIETDTVFGVKVADRAVVFAKDVKRIDGSVSFTVPGNEQALKVAVAGIQEGTWGISVNGAAVTQAVATQDGGMIYFTAPAGSYTLTYQTSAAIRPFIEPVIPAVEGIGLRFKGQFIYSDVPPTIRDGRTLVPMRVIFEKLGATLVWDDAAATATATKDGVSVSLKENSNVAIVNGEEKTLDVPATIINGRFVVPVRFVSETMGAKVEWDPFATTVNIIPGAVLTAATQSGYATVKDSDWSSNSDENIGPCAYDGDLTTMWITEGDGEWLAYEFEKAQTITAAEIYFNNAVGRQAIFMIKASEDGAKYTTVYEGKSDGVTDGFQRYAFDKPVAAKFMKFIGRGNTKNLWNNVRELRYSTK